MKRACQGEAAQKTEGEDSGRIHDGVSMFLSVVYCMRIPCLYIDGLYSFLYF